MNFEEAFAHYQTHTATPEEAALVERELEKFRLLEDYLAARELPELPEVLPVRSVLVRSATHMHAEM